MKNGFVNFGALKSSVELCAAVLCYLCQIIESRVHELFFLY